MTESGPNTPPPEPPSQTAAVTGWTKVTRAMARRATDIIAIAIVAVGILSISGRLTEWWGTDVNDLLDVSRTASQVAGTQTAWGTEGEAVLMRLGQLAVTVERQVLRGDQAQADLALTNTCRARLQHSSRAVGDSPDAAAEQDLLAGLKQLEPIEEQSGEWKLYRLDGENRPMVGTLLVGVRVTDASPVVACWGFVVPRDNEHWTIFLFDKTSQSSTNTSDISLPDDATPVLSVSDPQSGRLMSFEAQTQAPPDPELTAWRTFFGHEFSQRGWQTARAWTQSSQSWSARYERAIESRREAVEITLTINPSRRAVGVLNLIAERTAEKP